MLFYLASEEYKSLEKIKSGRRMENNKEVNSVCSLWRASFSSDCGPEGWDDDWASRLSVGIQHWPDGRRGQAVQPIREHGCPEVHNTYRIWLTSVELRRNKAVWRMTEYFMKDIYFTPIFLLCQVQSSFKPGAICAMVTVPLISLFCVYAFVFYHRIFLFQRLAKSCMWFWTKSCHKNFSCMTGLVY